MSVASLSSVREPRPNRGPPIRPAPSRRSIAGRRRVVTWTKRVLPLMALLLLATVMLWPQITERLDTARMGAGLVKTVQEGRLLNLRYHGVDERSRPYTVTAEQAQQSGPERIDLVSPKADLLSENGSWTMVVSENGVYMQHMGQLDLSGHVVVYRDNGVTLHTASAAVDVKAGAAAGNQDTHTEGPFGTLDSQGFALVDKGAVVQFHGKSRLFLNEQRH